MIAAIVLAAGKATRFGQCKLLVRLGEKTLLEHALDHLRASKVDDIVVVLGAYAEEIQRQVRFTRERVVFNPDFAEGMSTSIQAGLRALPANAEAAMIVLGDQPFVRPQTLDRLIDECRRVSEPALVPTYNGFRGNPVVVTRGLFASMLDIRGDIGCRAILGNVPVAKIEVDDRGVTIDIDTPEELERQPYAVATVVRAEAPTSAKPGDKAVILPDGTLTGWIGGSCAHDIVVQNALEVLEEGKPRLLNLASETPDSRPGIVGVPMQCYSGGALDIFIEPHLPSARLVIVGSEPVARALARIGKAMRFHVTVVDPAATAASIPDADVVMNELRLPAESAYVVVATHGRNDEEALEQASRTRASYIALVASAKRAAVVLQILRDRGVNVDGVHAPAGLDIGAKGAEEIALSILAEIVQERRAFRTPVIAPAREEAIDPVCGMTVDVAHARYTTDRDGQRYYFCCEHCRNTFAA